MRILTIVLVVTGILISAIAAVRTRTATITDKESHDNAADYGLHIAAPNRMKRFPAELVPLP